MGDQFAVLVLAGQGDFASEVLWQRVGLSLENKALDSHAGPNEEAVVPPLGNCAMMWTIL